MGGLARVAAEGEKGVGEAAAKEVAERGAGGWAVVAVGWATVVAAMGRGREGGGEREEKGSAVQTDNP